MPRKPAKPKTPVAPPPRTSRKAQKEATRLQLLAAARSVFEQQGYAGTQMADIARAADVAIGTLYIHFDGKELLFDALLEDFNQALAEKLTALQPYFARGDLATGVAQGARLFLDHWTGRRAFVIAAMQRLGAGVTVGQLRDGINPPAVAFLTASLSQALEYTPAHRRGASPVESDTVPLLVQGLLALWMRLGLQAVFGTAATRAQAERLLTTMTLGALQSSLPQLQSLTTTRPALGA